jgi:hypothetical protein
MSQLDGNAILLKIRLREGTQARLWKAETCTVPVPAAHVIPRSGIYRIPLPAMPGAEGSGICLASSDGSLAASLPLAGRRLRIPTSPSRKLDQP